MLKEYSVRLRTVDARGSDYHLIVPVRAGTPEIAESYARAFVRQIYGAEVSHCIVRYKGHALPTWCGKAQRVREKQIEEYNQTPQARRVSGNRRAAA